MPKIMNIDNRLKPLIEAINDAPKGDIRIEIYTNSEKVNLKAYESADGSFFCPETTPYVEHGEVKTAIKSVAPKDFFKLVYYLLMRKEANHES